jgi:hypothetical protein
MESGVQRRNVRENHREDLKIGLCALQCGALSSGETSDRSTGKHRA